MLTTHCVQTPDRAHVQDPKLDYDRILAASKAVPAVSQMPLGAMDAAAWDAIAASMQQGGQLADISSTTAQIDLLQKQLKYQQDQQQHQKEILHHIKQQQQRLQALAKTVDNAHAAPPSAPAIQPAPQAAPAATPTAPPTTMAHPTPAQHAPAHSILSNVPPPEKPLSRQQRRQLMKSGKVPPPPTHTPAAPPATAPQPAQHGAGVSEQAKSIGSKMRAEMMKEIMQSHAAQDAAALSFVPLPSHKRPQGTVASTAATALSTLAADVDAERLVIDTLTAKIRSLQAMQEFAVPDASTITAPPTAPKPDDP